MVEAANQMGGRWTVGLPITLIQFIFQWPERPVNLG